MISGDLKPISGPKIDGFGKNLLLRSDVEKLRVERDSFKATQVQAGKTARFGKAAGSRNRPVRDVIGPRIAQLIEEWQRESPGRHVTGQMLYQRLTNEGYQLGIISVYEYLKQKHPRAEPLVLEGRQALIDSR